MERWRGGKGWDGRIRGGIEGRDGGEEWRGRRGNAAYLDILYHRQLYHQGIEDKLTPLHHSDREN